MSQEKYDRLVSLAAYAPKLRDTPKEFIEFVPREGTGSRDDPYVMGTGQWILSVQGDRFVEMAYNTGWVLSGFDWPKWQGTDECKSLLFDRAILAHADEQQLARLLTAIIRKDRFAEGTLVEMFENGLLLAVSERAAQLAKDR